MLNRSRERNYQKLLKYEKNKGIFAGESVKDIEKSMGFGVSFIFTLFLSGLSGYYFGKHIMGYKDIYVNIIHLFILVPYFNISCDYTYNDNGNNFVYYKN